MMSRRKLYACGIIIAALSCVPAFAANSWSQFRDPDGAFTVDFPAPPTVKNLNDPTEPVVEYVFDGRTMSMLIIVGDFTGKNINESKAVDAAVSGMSRNHKLQSSKIDQLDGRKGRYVIFKDADGTELTDRIFFVKGRLYQALTALTPTSSEEQASEVEHFRQSFHFITN